MFFKKHKVNILDDVIVATTGNFDAKFGNGNKIAIVVLKTEIGEQLYKQGITKIHIETEKGKKGVVNYIPAYEGLEYVNIPGLITAASYEF